MWNTRVPRPVGSWPTQDMTPAQAALRDLEQAQRSLGQHQWLTHFRLLREFFRTYLESDVDHTSLGRYVEQVDAVIVRVLEQNETALNRHSVRISELIAVIEDEAQGLPAVNQNEFRWLTQPFELRFPVETIEIIGLFSDILLRIAIPNPESLPPALHHAARRFRFAYETDTVTQEEADAIFGLLALGARPIVRPTIQVTDDQIRPETQEPTSGAADNLTSTTGRSLSALASTSRPNADTILRNYVPPTRQPNLIYTNADLHGHTRRGLPAPNRAVDYVDLGDQRGRAIVLPDGRPYLLVPLPDHRVPPRVEAFPGPPSRPAQTGTLAGVANTQRTTRSTRNKKHPRAEDDTEQHGGDRLKAKRRKETHQEDDALYEPPDDNGLRRSKRRARHATGLSSISRSPVRVNPPLELPTGPDEMIPITAELIQSLFPRLSRPSVVSTVGGPTAATSALPQGPTSTSAVQQSPLVASAPVRAPRHGTTTRQTRASTSAPIQGPADTSAVQQTSSAVSTAAQPPAHTTTISHYPQSHIYNTPALTGALAVPQIAPTASAPAHAPANPSAIAGLPAWARTSPPNPAHNAANDTIDIADRTYWTNTNYLRNLRNVIIDRGSGGHFLLRCHVCGGNMASGNNQYFAGVTGMRKHINNIHRPSNQAQITAPDVLRRCGHPLTRQQVQSYIAGGENEEGNRYAESSERGKQNLMREEYTAAGLALPAAALTNAGNTVDPALSAPVPAAATQNALPLAAATASSTAGATAATSNSNSTFANAAAGALQTAIAPQAVRSVDEDEEEDDTTSDVTSEAPLVITSPQREASPTATTAGGWTSINSTGGVAHPASRTDDVADGE